MVRERQREREREGIPCRLYTVSTEPDAGLELMNCEVVICAKIKSQALN